MAIPNQSGYFDNAIQAILPATSDTWSSHAGLTWDAWRTWDTPLSTIVWYAPILDLGTPKNFTLNITTKSTGTVSYQVYTSTTGQFQGEETANTIGSGATNVASFSGQFVLVVVTATYNNTALTITDIQVVPKISTPLEILFKDLDTSTLPGTNTARTLIMTQPVSQILDVLITPQTVTSYALDLYVSSTATSNTVVPRIISKDATGPVIALVGLDNKPRDGVVDILIKALGSQNMVANNLVST
jgi:hypothetical protein